MLLNLSCMSDTHSAEDLLRRSFRQFQTDQALPKLQQQLADLEAERDRIRIDDEEAVAEILLIMRKVAALQVCIFMLHVKNYGSRWQRSIAILSSLYALHREKGSIGCVSVFVWWDDRMAFGKYQQFQSTSSPSCSLVASCGS